MFYHEIYNQQKRMDYRLYRKPGDYYCFKCNHFYLLKFNMERNNE